MGPDHTPWPAATAARYRAAGHWRGQSFGALLTALAQAHGDRTAVVGRPADPSPAPDCEAGASGRAPGSAPDGASAGEAGAPGRAPSSAPDCNTDGWARWTYRELDRRAHRLAAGLAGLGLGAGDRVVLQLPNAPEFLSVIFALFRLGAWPVFALPAHRERELGHFTEQTDAAAIITVDRHQRHDHAGTARRVAHAVASVRRVVVVGDPEAARAAGAVPFTEVDADPVELPDPDPAAVAFLQLSGGSTGLPKLIPRTHDDYLYSVRESARICGLRPESVYLAALPVAHNFPLSSPGVLGALHAGATTVLAPNPDADTVFELVERERVTITGVVPPLAAAWVAADARNRYDLSSLAVLQVGGAKCGPELAGRIGPALGCAVQQVFGMAEGLVNYTRLDDPEELVVRSQGRPISPDDEIRVVDARDEPVPDGEAGALLTRGPYTIRGYFRAAEYNATAFTADGFYRTGDLVRRLPTGHLEVVGRVKDQINRGGEKIAAEEVEDHLMAHPSVLDAAVVSLPDEFLGERSCAYVIPAAGSEAPTERQLRRFVRERGVATFKVPDRVLVVERFPVTGVGKTSKRELRAALRARPELER
ncbi:2,3-dihydroxybenzoate-AMP ligase [Pseudonocardia eucalypti]|uniref:(2,3-dihydroxybenzoyl)adenylate synthase n=1 Tax=Pseudonocardia eucalypti TaxID=648755 RepID=UPI0017EF8D1E|nr:2,3-dihydroxybenzoate-AMP ligase [Pseudonocardia eucalypti]